MDNWAGKAKANLAKYHFQTLITAPLFPISSLKKVWPGGKLVTIESKMSLDEINFSQLNIISFSHFPLASLPLLIKLEQTFEANFNRARLILVIKENLKAERLFLQNKESYFTKRLIYLPSSQKQLKQINKKPKGFFRLLSENQQLILQKISQNNLPSLFYQKDELDYLLKTKIIKTKNNHYQITSPGLSKYLLIHFSGLNKEVNLKKILPQLSTLQKKGFSFLVENQNKMVNREKLASCLWEKECDYSDYALDQFICRLRKKLTFFNLNHHLTTIKKQGFIFNPNKLTRKRIKYQGLEFIPFSPDSKLFHFYYQQFKKPEKRAGLYSFTPKTEGHIQAWLDNLINNLSFAYFLITKSNHPIGHIGLKMINQKQKTASIGTFLKQKKQLKNHGQAIYQFILNQAVNKGISNLYKDVSQYPKTTIQVLEKLEFKKIPYSNNLFFLNDALKYC